ncbi:MAG: hypothetical protein JSV08_02935 [Acidobacteriota bacterium]|nr:MAG: hypothetical protein JSV08_02935 [Acidobacteriota bacterium]
MAEKKEKEAVQAKVGKDHMELSFGPRWTYISCVRGFVAHFFAIGLEDKIHAERISLAVSELLENAVKYSSGPDTTVSASILGKHNKVVARVENQSTAEHIKELQGEIKGICQKNPEEAYMAKLMEAANRTDGKSQLGLARIRYETGAVLTVSINGDRVHVEATFPLVSNAEEATT